MKIDIPGIRPKILSENIFLILNELMSFRHVFRHAYNYILNKDRLELLKRQVIENQKDIQSDIEKFKKHFEERAFS